MQFRDRLVLCLATGFFSGRLPVAPGTFGTLIGLPICYLFSGFQTGLFVFCAVLFIIFSVALASAAEKILNEKDPAEIVIDEIAGILVTFAVLPFNLQTAVLGFIIFRVFDILKPFPIRWLERKISGGSGIVVDDVVAGIYANLVLRLIIFIYSIGAAP
jgi:phosphatidylglycerophosphatase A